MEREYLRLARRKARDSRGYFDDDDDDDALVGEGSNVASNSASGPADSDEIDPLDAFMADIDAQVKTERARSTTSNPKPSTEKPLRFNDDDDEYLEDRAGTHKKPRRLDDDSDQEVYATAQQIDGEDNDDVETRRSIEPIAPLDHSTIQYESFRKDFYKESSAVASLTQEEVNELRAELQVATDGRAVPRPLRSFMEVGFDRKMLAVLMKLELEAPTPIQAQTFPVALSGRDMIGIAKTGSGKTLAFTLPMVVHVMDQRELRKDEGPIAVVLSPTRELAHQIFAQVKKFVTVYGAQCAAVYGGVGKWDQIQALRKGAEVVVATPGRLIDLIRKRTLKMTRVTFVVLDEADRMFEMGFEPQLRSILGQIRPDRQTLMFSATFRKRVEALARDVLTDPVKVTIGKIGQANEDIRQVAVVLHNNNGKWPWLIAHLQQIVKEGRVLIFASSKVGCEELAKNLNAMQYRTNCLHGDKGQQERNAALAAFRSGECSILVATDVASRGLDVKDVKTVVNYDVAKNIDTHVHRIGRTGRMGHEGFEPGTAYTLITTNQAQFASELVYNMDVSGQLVENDLVAIARRDPRFRRGKPAHQLTHGSSRTHASASSGLPSAFDAMDDQDEAEMARWNTSQRKTKADQRKGLGFATGSSGGGGRMSFVKASTPSIQQSFHSAFVKPTTATSEPPPAARVPPPPPPAATVVTSRPPPPPPVAFAIPPHVVIHASVPPPPVPQQVRPPPTHQPAPALLPLQHQVVAQSDSANRGNRSSRSRSPESHYRHRHRRRSRSDSSTSPSRSRRRDRSSYRHSPSRSRSRSRGRSSSHSHSRRRRSPSRSRSRSRSRRRSRY